MARLKIGHTRLTHEHRLKGVAQPMCQECNTILTVEHILLNCKNRLSVSPADRKRRQKGETFMMSTTNSNTKSDAGSTQNKLQRPSVGNQA